MKFRGREHTSWSRTEKVGDENKSVSYSGDKTFLSYSQEPQGPGKFVLIILILLAQIQDSRLVDVVIKRLKRCEKLFFAKPQTNTWACIMTKGLDATILPQRHGDDLATAKLSFRTKDG